MRPVETDVGREQSGRGEHVVVHEEDPLAARARDAGISAPGEARVCLTDDVQGARRPQAADDLFVRSVGRAVVDEHDLIAIRIEILREQRLEHAAEERLAIIRAHLHGDEGSGRLQRRGGLLIAGRISLTLASYRTDEVVRLAWASAWARAS